MINVTNDAWFGLTPGPHQHFAQARLRTIEEGLPMIRAANNGVSAVIDPYGRVLASLPLGVGGRPRFRPCRTSSNPPLLRVLVIFWHPVS